MGIKEYFEKQPEPKDLKLQDITIEEEKSKKELKFDPEKDISPLTKKEIFDDLKKSIKSKKWRDFIRLAAYAQLLFSDYSDQINLPQDAQKEIKIGCLIGGDIDYPALFKLLFHHQAFSESKNKKILLEQQNSRLNQERKKSWINFLFIAYNFAISNNGNLHRLNLTEQDWKSIKHRIDQSLQEQEISLLIKLAAMAKLIFPQYFHEIKLTDKDWEKMKQEVDLLSANPDIFCHFAAFLYILAAHKAKITDQGIEITPEAPEDLKQPKKERPVRKKF